MRFLAAVVLLLTAAGEGALGESSLPMKDASRTGTSDVEDGSEVEEEEEEEVATSAPDPTDSPEPGDTVFIASLLEIESATGTTQALRARNALLEAKNLQLHVKNAKLRAELGKLSAPTVKGAIWGLKKLTGTTGLPADDIARLDAKSKRKADGRAREAADAKDPVRFAQLLKKELNPKPWTTSRVEKAVHEMVNNKMEQQVVPTVADGFESIKGSITLELRKLIIKLDGCAEFKKAANAFLDQRAEGPPGGAKGTLPGDCQSLSVT